MISRKWILCGAAGLALAGSLWALQGHDDNPDFPAIPPDHDAIQYFGPAADPVARLEKRLEKGEVKLEYQPRLGYLQSVLKNLGVNADSQLLVFSKTSSQNDRISPATPRALYFSDDVSVGYVQDGRFLELAALDPKQGVVFYALDAQKTATPSFTRQDMACIICHMSPATLNIPGLMVSTVFPTDSQSPYGRAGSYVTDHRTALEDRWGGWYVTGTHGAMHHRGNRSVDRMGPAFGADPAQSQNLTSLKNYFDTSAYLSPTSDIVALMTLEHQTHLSNLLTRIGWETRVAVAEDDMKEFGPRLDAVVDELVSYMLFADEAPIKEPIQGVSTFTKTFAELGPRDKQGRSLREFDLRKRLFRYPLSYMVYSAAFDSIPDTARERIYRKLYDALTGKDSSQEFTRLSAEDRRAVLEILRDTKKGLPDYWKNPQPTAAVK